MPVQLCSPVRVCMYRPEEDDGCLLLSTFLPQDMVSY